MCRKHCKICLNCAAIVGFKLKYARAGKTIRDEQQQQLKKCDLGLRCAREEDHIDESQDNVATRFYPYFIICGQTQVDIKFL